MDNGPISKGSNNAGLIELHQRITEVDQLEIERKRAEEKLRKVEGKIHKMFGKAEEVIVIVQDRQIKYINPSVEELTGFNPKEIIGNTFAHYIYPDELPRVAKFYLQRLAGEEMPNVYEARMKHKDGGSVPVEIKASVVQYQGRLASLAIARAASGILG